MKSYDTALAVAHFALSDGSSEAAHGAIAGHTTIPAERIGVAAKELLASRPDLFGLVALTTMMQGKRPSAEELAAQFKSAKWIDDGLETLTYSASIVEEEGGAEVASFQMKRKLEVEP